MQVWRTALCYLLLWQLPRRTAGQALLQVAVQPTCDSSSNGTVGSCTFSLVVWAYLTEQSELRRTIDQIIYNNVQYSLVPPVTVVARRLASIAAVPFTLARTVANAYEVYGYDLGCAVARQVGPCRATPNQFTLCCLGGLRGWGQHCLFVNQTAQYAAYTLGQPILQQHVALTLTAGPLNASFLLTPTARAFVSPGLQVTLDTSFVQPPDSVLAVAQQYLLARPMQQAPATPAGWFLLPTALEGIVGITPDAWKQQVSCQQAMHSATATHQDAAFVTDQFYPFRAAALGVLETLPAATGSATVDLQGNTSGWLSLPFKDVDTSHITVIYDNVRLR